MDVIAAWLYAFFNRGDFVLFVIPFFGALVAHLYAYDELDEARPCGWHWYSYFSRWVYACAAVWAGSQVVVLLSFPQQAGLLFLGACSIYPKRMVQIIARRYMKRLETDFDKKAG